MEILFRRIYDQIPIRITDDSTKSSNRRGGLECCIGIHLSPPMRGSLPRAPARLPRWPHRVLGLQDYLSLQPYATWCTAALGFYLVLPCFSYCTSLIVRLTVGDVEFTCHQTSQFGYICCSTPDYCTITTVYSLDRSISSVKGSLAGLLLRVTRHLQSARVNGKHAVLWWQHSVY